jgi:hypothetical protein
MRGWRTLGLLKQLVGCRGCVGCRNSVSLLLLVGCLNSPCRSSRSFLCLPHID